tara:strand:+ start:9770 stop:10105 length:336 start_codon:yes stop_codon:yes gene_type:complete
MKEFQYTIKNGHGSYSSLDKEYKRFIKDEINGLDDTDTNRWDIYNIIMDDLIELGLHNVFAEVKYRITDGEEPNAIMLEVLSRKDYKSELSWFLKNRVKFYIEEDYYSSFF